MYSKSKVKEIKQCTNKAWHTALYSLRLPLLFPGGRTGPLWQPSGETVISSRAMSPPAFTPLSYTNTNCDKKREFNLRKAGNLAVMRKNSFTAVDLNVAAFIRHWVPGCWNLSYEAHVYPEGLFVCYMQRGLLPPWPLVSWLHPFQGPIVGATRMHFSTRQGGKVKVGCVKW